MPFAPFSPRPEAKWRIATEGNCDFCGVAVHEYPVVEECGLRVCDNCLRLCEQILREETPGLKPQYEVQCSFCDSRGEHLIAGPTIYICRPCVHDAAKELPRDVAWFARRYPERYEQVQLYFVG